MKPIVNPNHQFKLKFDIKEFKYWAGRYTDPQENRMLSVIRPAVIVKGFYSKQNLIEVCYWKSPRSMHALEKNEDEFVREVTACAMASKNERLRIEELTILSGVSWPTASLLLHLGHQNLYPILDFRALWSLGDEEPKYDFEFWEAYTFFCRDLSFRTWLDIRDIDRALWQYSKENQRRRQ